MFFVWPGFNLHPSVLVIFFFWLGFNPHPGIHVKGDRYCIFAFLQDTNHVFIPWGEQSTKIFTQKVTFTYSANYYGLYYGDNRQLATSMPFGNGKKFPSKCPIGYLMKPQRSPMQEKKSSGLKLHWKILQTFPKCWVHAWFHSNKLPVAEKNFASSQKPLWLSG